MKSIKNLLTPAFIFVGIILGAGFASGAEIMAYFVDYGRIGLIGLFLSCFLLALTGLAIWQICKYENINSYQRFMEKVMGHRLAKILEACLGFFTFIVFSAMLAASGSAIHESINFSYSAGIYIVATVCFIVFLFDLSGIMKLNAYISPALIAGCIAMGLFVYFSQATPVFEAADKIAGVMRGNWLMSALTYAGYNITTSVIVLSAMGKESGNMKSPFVSALFSGILLSAMGLSIFLALSSNYSIVQYSQIPMLALITRHGAWLEWVFMILFLGACFTTAATCGFAFIETITGRININKTFLKIMVTVIGVLAAYAGFSNFIKNIYPLFAIAGIVEIILILKYYLKLIFLKI